VPPPSLIPGFYGQARARRSERRRALSNPFDPDFAGGETGCGESHRRIAAIGDTLRPRFSGASARAPKWGENHRAHA